MLVLTRQTEEEIIIGGDIRIKVVAISGGQVRLGIEAPPSVSITRSELHEAVARQNQTAAEASPLLLEALVQASQPQIAERK